MYAETVLKNELENIDLEVWESNFPSGGIGSFSAKTFGPKEIIGTYYRLFY